MEPTTTHMTTTALIRIVEITRKEWKRRTKFEKAWDGPRRLLVLKHNDGRIEIVQAKVIG